ncbi:nitrate- and nitrite sensing domain-containing protein, partial [Streptomyces coryli]|uniref:nitrate- and nitrite sensing domain-containing protein n=1 Tax=Streptomyces coryli TaxID=1128680 RepID=UPI0019D09B00
MTEQGRRPGPFTLRRLTPHTIRGRVAIVLAVPTCLLLMLTGYGVADRAADAGRAGQSAERVGLVLDVQALVRELQRERGLTNGLLGGEDSYAAKLRTQRDRADAARRRLDDHLAESGADTAPAVARALRGADGLEGGGADGSAGSGGTDGTDGSGGTAGTDRTDGTDGTRDSGGADSPRGTENSDGPAGVADGTAGSAGGTAGSDGSRRPTSLRALRVDVDRRDATPAAALDAYTGLITSLTSAEAAAGDAAARGDTRLARGMDALQALAEATEATALERGLLNGVFAHGRFRGSEFVRYAQVRAQREAGLRAFRPLAAAPRKAELDAALRTAAARRAAGYARRADAGAAGNRLGVDARRWWRDMTVLVDDLHRTQVHAGADVRGRADDLAAAARRQLVLFLLLGAAELALAAGLVLLAARSITRPLTALVSEADDVAGRRLPQLVAAIQEGRAVGALGGPGAFGEPGDPADPGGSAWTGLTGLTGLTGAAGVVGAGGASGVPSASGLSGAAGAGGATGLTRAGGAVGATGLTGAGGAGGVFGAGGLTGAVGATGLTDAGGGGGLSGAVGATGAGGVPGASGLSGAAGAPGAGGPTGAGGVSGATGLPGAVGVPGAPDRTGQASRCLL